MPKFSVVMPVYNREELVADSIRSALQQDYLPHEIIVVDDGSVDRSAEIVKGFGNEVNFLEQSNQGCAAARNRGVMRCTGDYIAFLDSDDLWYPWTLRLLAQIIKSEGSPAMLATSQLDFIDNTPRELDIPADDELRYDIYSDLLAYGFTVGTSILVIRRDVIEQAGGFVEENVNATDAEFNLRTGLEPGFVKVLHPPMLAYRKHETNVTLNLKKSWEGLSLIINQEHANRFQGSRQRRLDRWKFMTLKTRSFSIQTLGTDQAWMGWNLFRRTFTWNLRLGRWKYLLGFPVLALGKKLRIR